MRMNFPMAFNQYCATLEKHKRELTEIQFDIASLNEIKKTIRKVDKGISYTFSKIKVVIPKKYRPNHSIPRNIGNIEIVLSIGDEVIINSYKPNEVTDPLLKLDCFNIILKSGEYTSSWHLDRHTVGEDEKQPDNVHPIYHLTFGGHYMESLQNDGEDIFGNSLIVRAPRIMHPPMELILGLDFIFCHFLPKGAFSLLSDKTYISVISELKKHLWMPFALALAKNYCDYIDINRTPFIFDKTFVKSVVSW